MALLGIGIIYILSIHNSENKSEYLLLVKNKLSFLFIPLSLAVAGRLEAVQMRMLRGAFILCCLISSAWSYAHYIQDIAYYRELYSRGGVMPTLVHHVSFGVLLCLAVLFCIHHLFTLRSRLLQVLHFFAMIWMMYFVHLLSVRTGMVLLYVCILLYGCAVLIRDKKIVLPIVSVLLLAAGAYVAYLKIPTVKNKIDYTVYSIEQYQLNRDTTNQLSDSRRLLSDKIGIDILKQNPWFGTGIGDLQNEMNALYKKQFPEFKPDVYSHIHNQYLYAIAATGILLGGIFCCCLLLPLVFFIRQKNLVYSIAYGMLLLVMLWEPFIENQLGTSIFLLIMITGIVTDKE